MDVECIGLIVMGPSGCGKSEVGKALADYYHCQFLDGDSYHTPENIAKMKGGTPLTDSDRFEWLHLLKTEIGKAMDVELSKSSGKSRAIVKVVAGCSALRKSYRDILRTQKFKIVFVFLDCSQDLLESRMRGRKGHFMKVDMLRSQLETLEKPGADEVTILIKLDKNETLDYILAKVQDNLSQV